MHHLALYSILALFAIPTAIGLVLIVSVIPTAMGTRRVRLLSAHRYQFARLKAEGAETKGSHLDARGATAVLTR